MSECFCRLREKALGDGCQICNPEMALDVANDLIAELRAENEHLNTEINTKAEWNMWYFEQIEDLKAELAESQKQCTMLREFRDNCVSLTGSLWPQNETTEYLSKLLLKEKGE